MKNLLLLVLTAVVLASSCELEDPTVGVTTEQIISLSASQPEISADGISRLTLTATLEEEADPNLAITFTTESGTFPIEGAGQAQTTLTASGRTAEVILQSSNTRIGSVVASATVGTNYTVFENIEFLPALPDDILPVADRLSVATDRVDFAQITTTLSRDEGMTTVGTRIDYEVMELDTAKAEIVPFSFANANLQSVVSVKSANGLPGEVRIKISTDGDAEPKFIDITFTE